ncbi:hypothetical protein ACFWY9_28610 [Amycolatopsis sp. NPDC059027]|uniref:hypothetical protein n=1 Tax=Amycolatopsis sp. NPDC059027 TaxID=3346709 RepID=UPI00366B6CE9
MSFETAADRDSGNIRKALKGLVAVAPYETSSVVTTLVGTGGQITLPTGFKSVGWISSDGATESGDITTSEITGWGSATPLRIDVTEASATLQVSLLENSRLTRELYDSVDLSAKTVSTAGEVSYDIQAQPDVKYWRAIVISVDGTGPTRRYWATAYHKVNVTDRDDFVNANGDDPAARGVTLSASPDDVVGTLGTRFEFGPGFLARATDEGWTLAP